MHQNKRKLIETLFQSLVYLRFCYYCYIIIIISIKDYYSITCLVHVWFNSKFHHLKIMSDNNECQKNGMAVIETESNIRFQCLTIVYMDKKITSLKIQFNLFHNI